MNDYDGSLTKRAGELSNENLLLRMSLREQEVRTDQLRAQLEGAQQRNRIDGNKLDMLKEQLAEQERELTQLRAQLETSRQYRRELNDSNTFLKNQAKDLNAECARRRNENKGLQALLDEQEKELAKLHSDPFTRRTAELEDECDRLKADNALLAELPAKLDVAVAKRDEEIATLRWEIAGLKARTKQMVERADRFRAELALAGDCL